MSADPDSRAWQRAAVTPSQRKADALTAVGLFAASILSLVLGRAIGLWPDPADPALSAGILALMTLPLALRRVAPVPVLGVLGVGLILVGELQVPEVTVSNIALFMAIYSVVPGSAIAHWRTSPEGCSSRRWASGC